jgi:translocation and assembly module TamB
MSRTGKIAKVAGLAILGLMGVVLIAAFVVAQTDWFRNFVRQKIIAVTEQSTGGRVDIAHFDFDWTQLKATINGFVLHGTEKPGEAPLFQARRLAVELKLFSSLQQKIDLRSLVVDQPQANIIVYPDGSTNVPSPKVKKKSDTSALETLVDLAIKRFELNNGSFTFAMQKTPLDARGQNLRAQLLYNLVTRAYEGRLALDPLLVGYEKNPPLNIHAEIPVTIEKDRITLKNAKISTPQSEFLVNGGVENMTSPRTSAHVNARLSVQELAQFANLKVANEPSTLNADIAVTLDSDRIQISTARMSLGRSNIEASGMLKDPAGKGSVHLNATLATGELGRLFRTSQVPEGTVQIATTASSRGDFDLISLSPLSVDALGGRFAGSAELREKHLLKLQGDLSQFDIGTLSRALGGKPLGYDGVVSGPVEVTADLKKPGTTGVEAATRLAIAPGRRGVPVSGRLIASYNGAGDAVRVENSFVALPNTRLDVSGSLGQELRVKVSSSNLNDLKPVVPDLPVTLNGGRVNFDGRVTGSTSAPRIEGHLSATNFAVEGRSFDRLTADLAASPSSASVRNTVLTRGRMEARADAAVGLRKWKPEPKQQLTANAAIRNADLADLLALAGQKDIAVSGVMNMTAQLSGTIGNPRGSANLTATNGAIYDQPYDRLEAQVNVADQLVTIPSATLTAGPSRLELNASFQHPRDSFKSGMIEAHLRSNEVQLAQFQKLVEQVPGLAGTANTNLDVAANLNEVKGQTEFQVKAVNGNFDIRGLRADGEDYRSLSATLRTSGNTVNYRVDSNLAGSAIRLNGDTQLVPDYPTSASASISNLAIERVLALAGKRDIPAKGTLSGTANFKGTVQNPTGSADVTLTNAVLFDEPVERIQARARITPQSLELASLEAQAGPSRLVLNASYTHPVGDLMNGHVRFQVANSSLQLAQLRTLQKARPGIAGLIRVAADGGAEVRKTKDGEDIEITALNAKVNTADLSINRTRLGDANLNAQTRGDRLEFTLDSDFARSKIHGQGEAALRGDYPLTAQLSFSEVTYAGVRPLISASSGPPPEFDAVVDGQLKVSGPVKNPSAMNGRLEITRLQANTVSRPGEGSTPITLRNQGPIVASLDHSLVRIDSAHVVGPQTDINISGTAPLEGAAAMNVSVNANTNLNLLQQMSRNVYSSGSIGLKATVSGTLSQPLVNGRMELKDASVNVIDVPNGISHANGVIVFNGNTANIESLTAESGGGKINAGGFVGFGGGLLTYNLKVNADGVRVRYPPGASVNAGANLTLAGTSDRSVLGGTVIIQQIVYSPRSDFGSMLSSTAAPAKAPSAPSGPIAGMRLDIAIRTAPSVSFQTALAQNLQADADLHLRGNLANPGMTGRVNVSQGDLVFFGTKYTVNRGTISFYNPFDIKPILDIDLETVAKGVDVVLTISGPVENMKLTYRSDPPLQFQELVALLATGKTPTSDPTLVAKQPTVPAQSFQQMGESALVSQAIANPVASRLQRVFGVNKLKIDPTFTSGSELPQARLTLQQQVTSNVTFTYITNLTQANSQIIRIEWALNERWSAIATREENGRFGVDFFYKRKFR